MIQKSQSICSQKVFLYDGNDERVIIGSHFHAYIKLSEGCNQQCSFCAIPSFKGKLQSRSLESVLKELQNLYSKGYRDFSFIAQDSSSYLRDQGISEGLIKLIKSIDSSSSPYQRKNPLSLSFDYKSSFHRDNCAFCKLSAVF